MARKLSDQTGIVEDANYIDGKVVGGTTVASEGINQDIVQFFEYLKKILELSGTLINGLPDNETNGYQTILGLHEYIKGLTATTAYPGVVEKATSGEAVAGTSDKYLDAALFQTTNATETTKGTVEKATETEAKTFTASKYIDGERLGNVTGGLLTKVINIGDWDMQNTSTVAIDIPNLDYKKIRSIYCMIRSDDDGFYQNLERTEGQDNGTQSGSVIYAIQTIGEPTTSTSIYLNRLDSGAFDSVDYNETSYNRGFLTIQYLP